MEQFRMHTVNRQIRMSSVTEVLIQTHRLSWPCSWRVKANVPAIARAVGHAAAAAILALMLCSSAFAQDESSESDDDGVVTSARLAEARTQLREMLAPGAPREAEIQYLLRRERAAYTAGAGKVRLETLRRLVELHKGGPEVRDFMRNLWREEYLSGNQQRAIEMGEELLAMREFSLVERIEIASLVGRDSSLTAQHAKAQSMLKRAEALLDEYGRTPTPVLADRGVSYIELLRSLIAQKDARFEEAQKAVLIGLQAAEREIARSRALKAGNTVSIFDEALRIRNSLLARNILVLANAGKHVEAETAAREAIRLVVGDDLSGASVARMESLVARAQLAQRRYADAIMSIERPLATYSKMGLAPSSWRVLDAQLVKLQGLMGLERWAEADAGYASMIAATIEDDIGRRQISSGILRALLHAMNGRPDEALKVGNGVLRTRSRIYGGSHPLTVEAKAVRGMALQMQGLTGQAVSAYREVFSVIFSPEASYDETAPKGLRSNYLPLALRAYLKLVADAAAQSGGRAREDTVADAFMVADRLRSSRVQQALIDSATRSLVASRPELLALVRKEQDLRGVQREAYREVIKWLSEVDEAEREIVAAAKAQQDVTALREKRAAAAKAAEASRKQIAGIENERRALQREIVQQFPDYAKLVNPQAVGPAAAAKMLAADEAMVSVYSTPTHSFVWAIRANAAPVLHVAPLGIDAVSGMVAQLRKTLDIGDHADPVRANYDFTTAHRLYRELLEPVMPALNDVKTVNVVAGGVLGQIPFAVLVKQQPAERAFDSAAWLVRDFAISHATTVSAWLALRESAGKARGARPFFGFGDPQFSLRKAAGAGSAVRSLTSKLSDKQELALEYEQLPALPETRDEILAIAKTLGADSSADTLFGADASRANVLAKPLRDRRVLAFATHGLRAGELPTLSQPALALAASGNADDSPLLTLDDVLKLQLQADWVVLSACNTAAADGRSEEAISGLGRGFFYAGARSVLLTHWAVESLSAQALVTATFQRYAGSPGGARAESLRQAQLEMIAGKHGAQYRHPFFWAPYALVGDPSR